jgi:hypothetical protein
MSVLAWIGLSVATLTAGAFTILHSVDVIALKFAVDSWFSAPIGGEKYMVFKAAEGIRLTE